MRVIKKITTIALAIASVLSLASCTIGSSQNWAFKTDDTTMPAGLYIMNQIDSIGTYKTKLAEANADNAEFTLPTTISELLKTSIGDTKAKDWIVNESKTKSNRYFATKSEYERLGLSMSDTQLDYLDQTVNAAWDSGYEGIAEPIGIGKVSWNESLVDNYRINELFDAYYGVGGEKEVPEAELATIFAEKYKKATILQISKNSHVHSDNEEVAEEHDLTAELKELVDSYTARLAAGEPAEAIMYEYYLAITPAEQKDSITQEEPGSFDIVIPADQKEALPDSLGDKVFEATSFNKPVSHEGESSYYIILPIDLSKDTAEFQNYRGVVLSELKQEEFESGLDTMAAGMNISENSSVTNKFAPNKLHENAETMLAEAESQATS